MHFTLKTSNGSRRLILKDNDVIPVDNPPKILFTRRYMFATSWIQHQGTKIQTHSQQNSPQIERLGFGMLS